jgi:hypothetical protein
VISVQRRIAGREEHVMQARRSISGQLQDRLACLVPELLTHRGEQPFTAVAGMTRRQPPARISGVNRPHVPNLVALDVNDPDQFAAPNLDRLAGLRGDRDHPACVP